MTTITSLNKYQQRVVELMSNVNSDQQMAEITDCYLVILRKKQ